MALRSRSKVRVKVKGWGPGSRSNFWCTAVDIRGSAWLSAAKRNKGHTDIAYLSEMDRVNFLHQVLSDFVRNLQGNNNHFNCPYPANFLTKSDKT